MNAAGQGISPPVTPNQTICGVVTVRLVKRFAMSAACLFSPDFNLLPTVVSVTIIRPKGVHAAKNRRERQRKARRRAENRRLIVVEKAHGCWLCGRRDLPFDRLHFHHLHQAEKKDHVAHLVSRSTTAFRDEIDQCRLICFGCHEKHHEILDSEAWRTGGCYDL